MRNKAAECRVLPHYQKHYPQRPNEQITSGIRFGLSPFGVQAAGHYVSLHSHAAFTHIASPRNAAHCLIVGWQHRIPNGYFAIGPYIRNELFSKNQNPTFRRKDGRTTPTHILVIRTHG
jgi:hypothetical protein